MKEEVKEEILPVIDSDEEVELSNEMLEELSNGKGDEEDE